MGVNYSQKDGFSGRKTFLTSSESGEAQGQGAWEGGGVSVAGHL